ncbi:GntR family transcriptional regulator [Corynebacterium breve]|uniref:GntR family transcriptional regulator n=1 Tax=Corynebacterium breve TaxID=3049799 RepID=A0ABY8VDU4_9CORY|nr:GntR family transcriptional regulator [Corynebacterium breve]WIM67116.1 GntR family transcriptional regulator [Corynebacterium breve]
MSTLRPPQQHEEIAEFIRQEIFSGHFKAGDPLPSEAELCKQFDSSRGPVRQAMSTLRAEGLISSGRGRRSIVLDNTRTESFDAVFSVSAWLGALGKEPGQRTLWVARQPASSEIAEALEITEGDPIFSVHRVRSADGVPCLVERMHFPSEVGRLIMDFDTDSGSLHRHLLRAGVDFNNVSRVLTAIPANEEDAKALKVEEGFPLFRMTLRSYTHAGEVIEYADYRYRADQIRLGMNNVRGSSSPLWVEIPDQWEDNPS